MYLFTQLVLLFTYYLFLGHLLDISHFWLNYPNDLYAYEMEISIGTLSFEKIGLKKTSNLVGLW